MLDNVSIDAIQPFTDIYTMPNGGPVASGGYPMSFEPPFVMPHVNPTVCVSTAPFDSGSREFLTYGDLIDKIAVSKLAIAQMIVNDPDNYEPITMETAYETVEYLIRHAERKCAVVTETGEAVTNPLAAM